jgi:hypothetical protein
VMFWNRTPPTWLMSPTPAVPADALSGLAFSHPINSRKFFAGDQLFVSKPYGALPYGVFRVVPRVRSQIREQCCGTGKGGRCRSIEHAVRARFKREPRHHMQKPGAKPGP